MGDIEIEDIAIGKKDKLLFGQYEGVKLKVVLQSCHGREYVRYMITKHQLCVSKWAHKQIEENAVSDKRRRDNANFIHDYDYDEYNRYAGWGDMHGY